jgi:hypothetical protein
MTLNVYFCLTSFVAHFRLAVYDQSRLNCGNAFYHSFQNISPYHHLSEDMMIDKVHKTIILPVALHGYET